jgi:hypothetical protein
VFHDLQRISYIRNQCHTSSNRQQNPDRSK